MAYQHKDKKSGDLIKSDDWNEMSKEVGRLGSEQIKNENYFNTKLQEEREELEFEINTINVELKQKIEKSEGEVNSKLQTERKTSESEIKNITAYIDHRLPKGVIVMWSGEIGAILKEWRLCDGKNGTPDLRDRFIVGAGDTYSNNESGDADSHQHTVRVQGTIDLTTSPAGEHKHFLPEAWFDAIVEAPGKKSGRTIIDRGGAEMKGSRTESTGSHDHKISQTKIDLGSHDSSKKSEIRPKWYALCFIQKT